MYKRQELRGSSTGLGAKTDYLQLLASGERVFDIAPAWHLLLRAEFGTTWADDFDGVPGSERFFAAVSYTHLTLPTSDLV